MFTFMGALIGVVIGAIYFILKLDSTNPNATLLNAVFVSLHVAGLFGTTELLYFLSRTRVRRAPLLHGKHGGLSLAIFVIFAICAGRLYIMFFLP